MTGTRSCRQKKSFVVKKKIKGTCLIKEWPYWKTERMRGKSEGTERENEKEGHPDITPRVVVAAQLSDLSTSSGTALSEGTRRWDSMREAEEETDAGQYE